MKEGVTQFLDPRIIPNYGCADITLRGQRCRGSNAIDINKYCLRCHNYMSWRRRGGA